MGDIGRRKQRVLERAGVLMSRWESLGVAGSGGSTKYILRNYV